jgi:hypothetical protein
MAPEQVERPGDVDHRADIYSLGVVFYEMLTGELPLGRFAPPSSKSDVDARIDAIVLRTLEKERAARFQRVAEVKTSLETPAPPPLPAPAAVLPPVVPVPPPAPPAPPPVPSRLSKMAFGVAFAPLVVALVAVLAWSANSASVVDKRVGWAGLWCGSLAFVGVIASIAAWSRIGQSRGAMHGRWFTAIGFVGSIFAPLALVPLYAWDNTRLVAEGGSRAAFVSRFSSPTANVPYIAQTTEAQSVRRLVDRWVAALPAVGDAALSSLYSDEDLATLRAMQPDVRAARASAGLLGLPLVTKEFLGTDPALLAVDDMTFQGDAGTVSLRSGDTSVTAHVVRVATTGGSGDWRFALLPLTRLNHRRPPDGASTPSDWPKPDDTIDRPATPRPPK